MTQQTALQVTGLPGRTRTFSAKTAVTFAIGKFKYYDSAAATWKEVQFPVSGMVTGTPFQVIVTDNADGTVVLSTPQDIATTSSPTFSGLKLGIRKMSTTDDITTSDFTVELDASAANVTATLPSVVGISGQLINVTAIDVTNDAILNSSGAETLPDGTTSFQFLKVAEVLALQANSDETGWVLR